MDQTLGFYDDFYSKLDYTDEELFTDGFGGLQGTGVEDSIDLSAFLTQTQTEPITTLTNTDNIRRQESFPTLGNLENIFVGQQIQQGYSVLPNNNNIVIKEEPVDINYECESTVTSPLQSDMPQQQSFYSNLPQPSTGLTGNDNLQQSPYSSQASSPTSTTSSFKATPASKTLSKSSGAKRQRQAPEKGSTAYQTKREKNNVAVRKSREKSKKKAVQLQDKVKELTDENERLNKKVDLLTKELSVLKQLFTNVGRQVPHELQNC